VKMVCESCLIEINLGLDNNSIKGHNNLARNLG
jgi:hypothetical protein